MSFVLNLFRKSEKKSQLNDAFSSIYDLPQWNWNQIHLTGNYGYIIKKQSYLKLELNNSDHLKQLFNQIYDEYIEEFGLSDNYIKMIEGRKRIAAMQHQYIQTGDRSILNMIEIEELEMKNEFNSSEGLRYEAVVMAIEKRQSIAIDPKTITVYKYNNYIRNIKEETKNV